MKVKWLLSIVLLLLSMNCDHDDGVSSSKPVLDTTPHEIVNMYWSGGHISADINWRFISYEEVEGGITVTGAWNVDMRNVGTSRYQVAITKFTFEDEDEFQISVYDPGNYDIFSVILDAGESVQRQGNFTIAVASVDIANSIVFMTLWARISEV
ncbi:hypothetical protein ACFL55_02735 [Candidatus Latescibacterota bacterium]